MKNFSACRVIRLETVVAIFSFMLAACLGLPRGASARNDDSSPPGEPVKLVFIHHSCGENWLADDHGGLGKALGRDNYFVSDTNYGWGPDAIGDRTDITDWPEWFTGPGSRRCLKALYAENRPHSSYSRSRPDPGGENRVILFKSCFPNSNLEGRPDAPPKRGDGLTVGNAKALYNELLSYFAGRPDKLFVAITAPPVSERTYAANARAFNSWLVKDWLAGYKGTNVAVFDFYNVLTGPGNHHRFRNGRVEHITQPGKNTLHYPTNGDDHPSPAGNRKATREFVPLLNVYVHRWLKGAPPARTIQPTPSMMQTPAHSDEKTAIESTPEVIPERQDRTKISTPSPQASPSEPGGAIDGFEGTSCKWESFIDAEKDTRLTFEPDHAVCRTGKAALRMVYDIASNSWATCSLVFPGPQDWQKARGLTVHVHGEKAKQALTIVAYQGNSPDNLGHFEYRTETTGDAVTGWQRIEIPWGQFRQAAWEGDGTAKFDPTRVMGMAFAFEGEETGRRSGRLWVDDIALLPPGSFPAAVP